MNNLNDCAPEGAEPSLESVYHAKIEDAIAILQSMEKSSERTRRMMGLLNAYTTDEMIAKADAYKEEMFAKMAAEEPLWRKCSMWLVRLLRFVLPEWLLYWWYWLVSHICHKAFVGEYQESRRQGEKE